MMSLQFYVVNVGYGFLKMARPAVEMESIKQSGPSDLHPILVMKMTLDCY